MCLFMILANYIIFSNFIKISFVNLYLYITNTKLVGLIKYHTNECVIMCIALINQSILCRLLMKLVVVKSDLHI